MPSRVGHVTEINEDGTLRIVNEIAGEEWFGQIVVGSGGMLMFDVVDERLSPVNGRGYEPEGGEAPEHVRETAASRTRVRVGRKKDAPVEEPTA